MNKKTKTWRTAVLLATLTAAPQLVGNVIPNTLEMPSAQAQPRFGTPEWDRTRNSRRARDYRDNDLARLSWATIVGQVTNNPDNDYFELRSQNGDRYRVLARSNVSLRGINRNDRVRVYGKRDGNILIAYSIADLGGTNSGIVNLRSRVVDNLSGNRFTIRYNNSVRTVVAERGEPRGLRAGVEVDLTGRWRNNIFYATAITVRDNNWGGGWQDGQTRTIRGTALTDLNNRRFTFRVSTGQTINISTRGSNVFRFSRGDQLELTGRWDRGSNLFEVSNGRVIRSNDDDFTNGRRVDFEGRVTKASRMFNTWFYTVRTDRGRDVTVRYNRQFRVGDRVEVEGLMQNNVVVASRMNRD